MSASIEQLSRVQRFLARVLANRNRPSAEYEDDVWSFFQHAWHLKDWVKGDQTLSATARLGVERDLERVPVMMICADLANRSKHFTLKNNRVDADISQRVIDVRPGVARLTINGHQPDDPGYVQSLMTVSSDSGIGLDVRVLAQSIVDEWVVLLRVYGLPIP